MDAQAAELVFNRRTRETRQLAGFYDSVTAITYLGEDIDPRPENIFDNILENFVLQTQARIHLLQATVLFFQFLDASD